MSKQTKTLSSSMTNQRLNACTRTIIQGGVEIQTALVEIALAEAWQLKNYPSFKPYAQAELTNWSVDTLYRMMNCGTLLYELAGIDAVGVYSNYAIEPLYKAKLKPRQLKKIWRHICRKCKPDKPVKVLAKGLPNPKKVTRKAVEEALIELDLVEPKPTPKTTRKEIKRENVDEAKTPKQSSETNSYKSGSSTKKKKVTANSFHVAMEAHGSTPIYAKRIGEAILESFDESDVRQLCKFLTRKLQA